MKFQISIHRIKFTGKVIRFKTHIGSGSRATSFPFLTIMWLISVIQLNIVNSNTQGNKSLVELANVQIIEQMLLGFEIPGTKILFELKNGRIIGSSN